MCEICEGYERWYAQVPMNGVGDPRNAGVEAIFWCIGARVGIIRSIILGVGKEGKVKVAREAIERSVSGDKKSER